MSLYNMLFGVNPFSSLLLQMLETDEGKIPRYRDCFLNEAGDEIIIHTRTGGGNRDDYEEGNNELTKIAGYKFDEDDDFDWTYANFHYAIPEAFKDMIPVLKNLGAINNPQERWASLLEAMKKGDMSKPETKRAVAIGEQIMEKLNERR